MQVESGGCGRLISAAFLGLIGVLVVFAVIIGPTLDSNLTDRVEAKASAKEAQASYAYQARKAEAEADVDEVRAIEEGKTERQLNAIIGELDKIRAAQAAYEQRLGTLAVILASLSDNDAERLAELLAEEDPGQPPWVTALLVVAWGFVGLLAAWGVGMMYRWLGVLHAE